MLAFAFAAFGCAKLGVRQTCATNSECGAGAVCQSGQCEPIPDAGAAPPDAGATDAGTSGAGDDAGMDAGNDAGADAGVDGGADAGNGAGPADAGSGADGGSVGYGGGSVDLLDFALTGDTRPPFCDLVGSYPSAVIQSEVTEMARLPSQFAADLGDHMYACLPTISTSTAVTQMGLYASAVSAYPHPWFMTMGNHECYADLDCSNIVHDADPNYQAYLTGLLQVSKQLNPYYSIDINTRLGVIRLVFIADDYASAAQQDWLGPTLDYADAHAVHTIILKHHPYYGDTGPGWMWPIIASHKVSLMLTAHEHYYEHNTQALDGRTVICGLGGADTSKTGFCRVQQNADNSLTFTEYDLSSNPLDTWTVTPP